MSSEELVALLKTEGDELAKEPALEVVRRGAEMIPLLSDLVAEKHAWKADEPRCWAPIHATLLLGAIGGEEAVVPILMALRWADAFDCDWVYDKIPSICGRLGMVALGRLRGMASDPTTGWLVRSMALHGMAAVAHRAPEVKDEVFEEIGRVLSDPRETQEVRGTAGSILLDFRIEKWRDALVEYAREAQKHGFLFAFGVEDVETAFSEEGEPKLGTYTSDWMRFYEPEEIAKRAERRENELTEDEGIPDDLDEGNEDAELPPKTYVRPGPKIGRNAPCPCGSGKKYKKCCLAKDEAGAAGPG